MTTVGIAQSPASTSFVLAFDEWMTGNTRAEQFQYWVPLELTTVKEVAEDLARPPSEKVVIDRAKL